MCYISKVQTAVCIIFCLFIANATSGLAAAVPLVPQWAYWSQNGNDYRSFNGEMMTVDINTPETTLSTGSQAVYPANQNFTVSVDFSSFSIQGAITNPSAVTHSDVQMAIQWDIGEIDGSLARSEIDVRRTSKNDGSDEFGATYGTHNGTTYESFQNFSAPGSDSSGKFIISKDGAVVTVSVNDTNGVVLHTWTFDSIETINQDIKIQLRMTNGPRERTSAVFSNLDMGPVPVDIRYTSVRNQIREGGEDVNRVAFVIYDTSGELVTSDVTNNVQLFGPSEAPISLGSSGYYFLDKYLSGRYDSAAGRWDYGSSFLPDSGYATSFSGDLPAGNYRLVITTTTGIVYDRYINYGGKKTLPIISSTSFYSYKDENGNLLFSWKNPYDLNFIAAPLNTSLRAWINVY